MNDFSKPQRQSLVGVVVMFADTLQTAVRALWPIIIVSVLKSDTINKLYMILAAIILFIVLIIIAYLKYLNFTFYLDEENEEFIINKGVWNKSKVSIKLDKIQQVNINQSLIQKVINVYTLEIDTAGSEKNEVSIKAIKHELALSLKARLLEDENRIQNVNTENEEVIEKEYKKTFPFINISTFSLIKTGLTSNYVKSFALLIVIYNTLYQNYRDYFYNEEEEENFIVDEYISDEFTIRSLFIFVFFIFLITLFINLIRIIFKYFDYKISKQQNSLLLSYGLANTKNIIIRPKRVQIIVLTRNYFQKKLNVLNIKIKQTSLVVSNNQQQLNIEIPGCNNKERDALLEFFFNKQPEKGYVLRPSIRKVIVQCIKYLILPVIIFFVFGYFIYHDILEYAVYIPGYILFIGTLLFFSFKNSRLFITDEFIIKQNGAWDIDTSILQPHKIQSIDVTQYFWQAKSNIGSVTLHTAGGNITFSVADYTKIKTLVNYWLYQVESGNKNWM